MLWYHARCVCCVWRVIRERARAERKWSTLAGRHLGAPALVKSARAACSASYLFNSNQILLRTPPHLRPRKFGTSCGQAGPAGPRAPTAATAAACWGDDGVSSMPGGVAPTASGEALTSTCPTSTCRKAPTPWARSLCPWSPPRPAGCSVSSNWRSQWRSWCHEH